MNADELIELASVLTAIAGGKAWQIKHETNENWRDPVSRNPLHYVGSGTWKIRLKPWELTGTVNGHTLPDGAEWHRQDFTEDMLPAPYRPLMSGEFIHADDEFDYDQTGRFMSYKDWGDEDAPNCIGAPIPNIPGLYHHRTTRTIKPEDDKERKCPHCEYAGTPAWQNGQWSCQNCFHSMEQRTTTLRLLTPAQIADGWIPWSGGECPVEPESQPTVMLQDGTILPVRSSASRMDWKPGAKPDGDDIIAYKPDPYGKFRQALADGETVQFDHNGKGAWLTMNYYDFGCSPDRYRIKPEPQWLPLGPEDVEPLSMIRRKGEGQSWHWRLLSYVHGTHAICADRGYAWSELARDYEINRPRHRDADGNPTLWEECRKQAP